MSNVPVDPFDGETLDVTVPESLDGMRVDRVISMLTGLSRSEATALVHEGRVVINDAVITKASLPIMGGVHLVAELPPVDTGYVEPDEKITVDVVLEDESFVVANKGPGQVVHPGAGQRDNTLIAGLLARYPEMQDLSNREICEPGRPGIVHRLDKGTSGLLVVARTAEAFYSLSAQLADRSMRRTYLGLVEGHVTEERGVVDAPIGRSSRTPTMMVVRADGRPARTGYGVLQRIEKPHAATLLELKLETGRTHQIRVHLATIGHPVVNDTRYGHRRDRRLEEERFFLHSTALSFLHPSSNQRVETHQPLPADLAALVPEYRD